MTRRCIVAKLLAAVTLALATRARAQPAPQLLQLNPAQLWQRLEFAVTNIPASSNPFDSDLIRLDAVVTLPSGRVMTIPAFWFQDYQRSLVQTAQGTYEYLAPAGVPGWRLRLAPPESGSYSVLLTIRTNGQLCGSPIGAGFSVPPAAAAPGSGYVRLASSKQYFETGDGQALRLIGENVSWYLDFGTYNYDAWFGALHAAKENFARVHYTPWAFGIETASNSLTHYDLPRAWQMDYVLQLAEQLGLYVLPCLEFHLMLQPVSDYWGNDNYWQSNPYNAANGGPCINQDAFFTNAAARATFQKRLRYLIGRYGYNPRLLAWQFWSEIDNEYAWLTPSNVAAWHGLMGAWMRTNDPFGHLVTTSLTGGSDRPEIWTLPQMDFACYHCYSEPFPALRLNTLAQSFHQRYGKPLLIDEFGTSWQSWNRTNDPYLRGFRQGLWGGAVGGSVGAAISYWWEDIDSENDYSYFTSLGTVLNRTGWGIGTWTNIGFISSGPPPATVGDLIPGGQAFAVQLTPSGVWGDVPSGRLAVPNAQASGYAGTTLNSFVQGWWHPELTSPFVLSAWFTNGARLVMHLNSVSDSATMLVRVDGSQVFSTNLPNLDGTYNVNNEYNLDIPISLASGKHSIEITNPAAGWFYLDWVRLEQVLPSAYASGWSQSCDAIGLSGPHESLLYVTAPGVAFSASSTNAVLPLQQGQSVTLTNWPAGAFFAEWYDPSTAVLVGRSQAVTSNSNLTLPLPDFREDLAGILYGPPTLKPLGNTGGGLFQFELDSETGGSYVIEQSPDILHWTTFQTVTNSVAAVILTDGSMSTHSRFFFRARQSR
jgi:hypothetical protein